MQCIITLGERVLHVIVIFTLDIHIADFADNGLIVLECYERFFFPLNNYLID